ncbi:substrate-binding domain-containing protein, partial [Nocardioides sp.]|uniref:substrate-binding domain-containing protein n=1 Tax=Nocardioides sp. TaxID=35761 RepID=UPI0025F1E7B4
MNLKSPARLALARRMGTGVVVGLSVFALSACISNTLEKSENVGGTSNAEAGSNDEKGDTVVIGFSAPAADHGWMGAISEQAQTAAEAYEDVDFRLAEGTNEVGLQISQVETFINDKVDAIVLLPFDGAALTPVALKAMEAGIR